MCTFEETTVPSWAALSHGPLVPNRPLKLCRMGYLESSFHSLFFMFSFMMSTYRNPKTHLIVGNQEWAEIWTLLLREHRKPPADAKVTHLDRGGWEVGGGSKRPYRRGDELSQFQRVTGLGILCNLEETSFFQTSGAVKFECLLSLFTLRQIKRQSVDARWPAFGKLPYTQVQNWRRLYDASSQSSGKPQNRFLCFNT